MVCFSTHQNTMLGNFINLILHNIRYIIGHYVIIKKRGILVIMPLFYISKASFLVLHLLRRLEASLCHLCIAELNVCGRALQIVLHLRRS